MVVYPFRRFFARLFDMILAQILVLWGLLLWVRPISQGSVGWISSTTAYLLLMVIETMLLVLNISTPGKWIFGIRILPAGDSKVTIWRALDRSFTVLAIGAGLYLPIINWYAGIQSYRSLTETGSTIWDRGKFNLVHGQLRWWRFLAAGVAVMMMFGAIVATLVMFQRF